MKNFKHKSKTLQFYYCFIQELISKHIVFADFREICSYQRYKKRQKVNEAVTMLNEYEKKRAQSFVEGEPTET